MQVDPANNRQSGDLETSNVADAEEQMKEVRGRYRIALQADKSIIYNFTYQS
jgi:hypothetical protein